MKHVWSCTCGTETEVVEGVFVEAGSVFQCPGCKTVFGCLRSKLGPKEWVPISASDVAFKGLLDEYDEEADDVIQWTAPEHTPIEPSTDPNHPGNDPQYHTASPAMTNILDLPIDTTDIEAETIGDYLIALLLTLWEKEDRFSGKRPFGNSGWKYDVYDALVRGGAIDGDIPEDDRATPHDFEAGDKMIIDAIKRMRLLQ